MRAAVARGTMAEIRFLTACSCQLCTLYSMIYAMCSKTVMCTRRSGHAESPLEAVPVCKVLCEPSDFVEFDAWVTGHPQEADYPFHMISSNARKDGTATLMDWWMDEFYVICGSRQSRRNQDAMLHSKCPF